MKFNWLSPKKAPDQLTVGRSLNVELPMFGTGLIKAKVDTGAYSGALHATDIFEVEDKHGRHLSFKPLEGDSQSLQADKYHKRRVKSSNGLADSRYAIDTKVNIQGHSYPITLTLTNRADMKYQMLIGRNFLRQHGFLVDVNRNSR